MVSEVEMGLQDVMFLPPPLLLTIVVEAETLKL